MYALIGLIAIVFAWQLAARPDLRPGVPLLVPLAVAVISWVLWSREAEEDQGPIAVQMAVTEILTLISVAGGFAHRRYRTRRERSTVN